MKKKRLQKPRQTNPVQEIETIPVKGAIYGLSINPDNKIGNSSAMDQYIVPDDIEGQSATVGKIFDIKIEPVEEEESANCESVLGLCGGDEIPSDPAKFDKSDFDSTERKAMEGAMLEMDFEVAVSPTMESSILWPSMNNEIKSSSMELQENRTYDGNMIKVEHGSNSLDELVITNFSNAIKVEQSPTLFGGAEIPCFSIKSEFKSECDLEFSEVPEETHYQDEFNFPNKFEIKHDVDCLGTAEGEYNPSFSEVQEMILYGTMKAENYPSSIEMSELINFYQKLPRFSKLPLIKNGVLLCCLHCDWAFTTFEELNKHHLLHEKVEVIDVVVHSTALSSIPTCSYCHKVFLRRCELTQHVKKHSSMCYECDYCEKAFDKRKKLILHRQTHASSIYECSLCDLSYTSQVSLENHLKNHNSPYHICLHCKKRFTAKSDLIKHKKTHSTVSYKCPKSHPSLAKQRNLINCLPKQSEKKFFKCSHCNLSYSKESNLQVHLQMHIEEIPQKCFFCERVFTKKKKLLAHLLLHAEEKRCICTLCGKWYQKMLEAEHLLTNHNITAKLN